MLILILLAVLAGHGDDRGRASFVLNGAPEVAIVLAREGGEPVRHVVRRGEPLAVDLTEGNWSVALADGAELWHQRQDFYVPASRTTNVVLDVWPRASVSGKVTVAADEVHVRFEPVVPGGGPSGEVRCPVERNAFRCALPAGEWSLRLRPMGFVAQYASVALQAGQSKDLGTLIFVEGQSITGRVEVPKSFDPTQVVVTATPQGTDPGSLAIAGRAEKNGFFHVDGVAPGSYVVRAACGQALVSARVEVEVRAGREAELIEPLRLDLPRQIRLTLVPPLTPEQRPWHVRLARRAGGNMLERIAEANAKPDGTWQSPVLQPNAYEVEIGTLEGDVWHRETIELASEDVELPVAIAPGRSIRGAVTLGEKPLQAQLAFLGERVRVHAQSDEDGRFSLVLPKIESDSIDVRIDAKSPTVQRRVTVKLSGESLDIRLPSSVLAGEVVDAAGAPVEGAILFIGSGEAFEGLVQPETDANGRFEAHGLAPGRYDVMASAYFSDSATVSVELKADETPEPVRLVMRDNARLRGHVVSSHGGVPGARVHARASDVRQMISMTRPTDPDGSFLLAVPREARAFDVTVAPPGFAYLITGVVRGERPLTISVEQRGGTLVVLADRDQLPSLVHNGGTASVAAVSDAWPVRVEQRADGAQQFSIPMMDPGSYAACVDATRCAYGSLAPFGTLTLDARSKSLR